MRWNLGLIGDFNPEHALPVAPLRPRLLHMHFHRRPAFLVAATFALVVGGAAAQDVERVSARVLQEVMPEADRFDPAEGSPPVKRAYRGEELIGYVFLTSDVPPEVSGYSGPIRSLVGITIDGVLTGVRVTAYRESLRSQWGDFLDDPALLGQFVGRGADESFGVGRDIDGISGATISSNALARGVRDAARRVAVAYAPPPEQPPEMLSEEELVTLSWYEIQLRDLTAMMSVRQTGRNPIEVSLIHMGSEELARHLVGHRYEALAKAAEEAGGADEIVLYVVAGTGFVPSLRTGWSIEQGGRTVEILRERVVNLGSPGGALTGQSSQVGALLLDDEEVDIAAPLTIAFDRGRPDLGTFRAEYTTRAALVRMAEARGEAEAEPVANEERVADADTAIDAPPPDRGRREVALADATGVTTDDTAAAADVVPASDTAAAPDTAATSAPPSAVSPGPGPLVQLEVAEVAEDDTTYGGTIGAVWPRVGWTVLVIALACLAFLTKATVLRWTSLSATVLILGWVDGGFLSISHVTGLVWVGPVAIMSDPSLLVMAVFTVATMLLWGRVFCGYLCPFGALQDFIDRLVPRRFKRRLPPDVHRAAWKAKYLILAVILGAAIIGVQASLYQYFEPFGTVFFLSSNALLWAIAGVILIASVVVPRFYCRYVCPLGALLAIGSVFSLRRIPRVEQCDYCRVCEQRCPTGAISGPTLDFGECVRCNVCEVQLLRRRGVCRHEMEDVRPRLVQLRAGTGAAEHRKPEVGAAP